MESNEQTEQMSKNRDRVIVREQMTAAVGGLEGGGIEQKGKRTRGHGQQHGDCWVEGSIRGLIGNGGKYNKD